MSETEKRFNGYVSLALGIAVATNHNWIAIIGVLMILQGAWWLK